MFAKRYDKWVDAYCKNFPFSGSICITKGDDVIYRRNIGLSNRELNVPIEDNTRFRLYSLTKPFTALGLLRLYEQGKVSLEAHPGEYLSEAVWLHPDITVRMLLDHSHGLPDFSRSGNHAVLSTKYPVSDREMLDSIREIPMDFAPGTACNYTNTGFYLASMIIEAVSGLSFRDYMEKEVFAPLGMKTAVIDSAYRLISNRASGYDIDGDEIIAAPYLCADWMKGAGAAIGTVDDVYKLHVAAREKKFLKPETWDLVFTPNQGDFGLGCSVLQWHDKVRYQHNGGHLGFRTLHIQLPKDDFGIILLSNMGFGNARYAFSEAAYQLYYGAQDVQSSVIEMDKGFAISGVVASSVLEPQRPEYVPCDLDAYVGTYKNDVNSITVVLATVNGVPGLCATYKNGRRLNMYSYGPDEFYNGTIDESYAFLKNENGKYFFLGMEKQE